MSGADEMGTSGPQSSLSRWETNDEESEESEISIDNLSTRRLSSSPSREHLNHKQWEIYSSNMQSFFSWMIECGKDPENHEGLAENSAEDYLSRLDRLYRQAWERTAGKSLKLSPEVADILVKDLESDDIQTVNGNPFAESSKRKLNDTLRKYFEWQSLEQGVAEWEPPHEFNDQQYQPVDFFTSDERDILREASLEYDTILSYDDCSPEQRDELKAYLAQRLGIPKADISPEDWRAYNQSWEIPSLIWVSLDAGLRPIEVNGANVDWLRPEKQSILIPKEKSAKNRENWEVALNSQTAKIAARWLDERAHLKKYEGSKALWLTREGNRRDSDSLCPLIRRLAEEGDIDLTNRDITWYSIRHSLGQYMTEKGGLEQAKAQLRHKSIDSTLQYTRPTLESRRDTLDGL